MDKFSVYYCISDEKDLFAAPEPPKTAMDALLQRLDKYKNASQQAKEEGNSSKARRMGRIVKVGHFKANFTKKQDIIWENLP